MDINFGTVTTNTTLRLRCKPPPNLGNSPCSLRRHGPNAPQISFGRRFNQFPSQPIGLKLQRCTSIPFKVQPHMASSLSQIPRGPHPNQPTTDSTATPTQHPPLRSPSSNSLVSPAPKRSLATSVDPYVLSKPHKHLRDQPEPLNPYSTDTGVSRESSN